MAKWLPTAIPALLGILAIFATPIQAFMSTHPSLVGVLAAIIGIVNHILPSPTAQPTQ